MAIAITLLLGVTVGLCLSLYWAWLQHRDSTSQGSSTDTPQLKNAKTLYDMGMKVAAVSVMCQDQKVFDAMMMAGTPCPYDGLIGEQAKLAWSTHTDKPPEQENADDVESKRLKPLGIIGGLFGSLLFF